MIVIFKKEFWKFVELSYKFFILFQGVTMSVDILHLKSLDSHTSRCGLYKGSMFVILTDDIIIKYFERDQFGIIDNVGRVTKDDLASWYVLVSSVSMIEMWLFCDFCTT